MLQVHVVTAANRVLYERQMDVCFQWRHRIYVEDKKWMQPRPDGREIDEFDTDDASYLLAFRNNEFVASSRLRPFSAPTLLADVFPHLVGSKQMPDRPEQAEWTRMFVIPDARERGHKGVAAAMCCAVMEYCVEERIAWLGGIQETYWLPRWMDYGWHVEPLGLPQDVDGTSCIAALFKVGPDALDGVRRSAGVFANQLVRIGPRRDFVTGRIHPEPAVPAAESQIETLPSALS